jgi:hypothetical protein
MDYLPLPDNAARQFLRRQVFRDQSSAPETFVAFKRWMAAKAPTRPEAKRRRDIRQADIVQKLLDEGLLLAQQ